jgi:uncharacterized protein YjbI with pentapeptide repeats
VNDNDTKVRRLLGWALFFLASGCLIPVGILNSKVTADTDAMWIWALGVFQDFVVALYPTAFVLIAIDPVLRFADRNAQNREQREQHLVETAIQLGSRSHDVALHAAEELRRWGGYNSDFLRCAELKKADLRNAPLDDFDLEEADLSEAILDGAELNRARLAKAKLQSAHMKGATLIEAILDGAHLKGADLEGAELHSASLQNASLSWANMQAANLYAANLQKAHLVAANLQGANLQGANLQGANLFNADLRGTHLRGADLRGAYISYPVAVPIGVAPPTKFDETTELPDSSMWHPYTNLTRFTNPEHANFWQVGSKRPFVRQMYVGVEIERTDDPKEFPGVYQHDNYKPNGITSVHTFMTPDNTEVVLSWLNGVPKHEHHRNYVYYIVGRSLGLLTDDGKSIPRELQSAERLSS